jgi:hypothetical protein
MKKLKQIFKKDAERMRYPKPKMEVKKPKESWKIKPKRGQMMLLGVIIMVMTIILFISTLPAIQDSLDVARQSDNLNCDGYTHPTDDTLSNNDSLREDTLSCTMLNLTAPYLILGIIVALVAKLIHGRLTEEPQQQPYYPSQY